MPDEISFTDVREQIRRRAVAIYGACSDDELTVLCRLVFWVLTATDGALAHVDRSKLGVVYGLFQAELTRLSQVTMYLAEEARGRGQTDDMIGPLLEARVYRELLHQPYPPEVGSSSP
ncbi:MAG: hypothetical protein M3361_06420 [Candidatus Tectomicrobia bacterium]|jgi:hypothetical protein|nr:hypothetical protein [Candidatus Tectomicrobia bacterium]